MNLQDALTAIMREHQIVPCSQSRAGGPSRYWALCEGCDWQSDHLTVREATQTARASLRAAHESHVADRLIAYLRDNLAQHGEELGMNRRTRNVDYGNDPLPPTRVKQVRHVTDWSRDDD